MKEAHLSIWDEPLNFIGDVYSGCRLRSFYLLMWKPTLLFVEHDAVFTEENCNIMCVESESNLTRAKMYWQGICFMLK